MTPLGDDPAPRPGARGSWNVVREVHPGVRAGRLIPGDDAPPSDAWARETWVVDLSRDAAIDEATLLQDQCAPTVRGITVRYVVESADGLRRIEIR